MSANRKDDDYSVDEFRLMVGGEIAEIQAAELVYEERLAIQAVDDGLTTNERAIRALERPERFAGEHDIARAWLKSNPNAAIFTSNHKT